LVMSFYKTNMKQISVWPHWLRQHEILFPKKNNEKQIEPSKLVIKRSNHGQTRFTRNLDIKWRFLILHI
jgi:hypothetical protein